MPGIADHIRFAKESLSENFTSFWYQAVETYGGIYASSLENEVEALQSQLQTEKDDKNITI